MTPNPFRVVNDGLVEDTRTGLFWSRSGDLAGVPLTWSESLEFAASLNQRRYAGFDDWRLPNRRELLSLLSFEYAQPALLPGHPFTDVFQGRIWTSTTAALAPAYAWWAHLAGARSFYGNKGDASIAWPVRGMGNNTLAATGQTACFDDRGRQTPCPGTGQDGEYRFGRAWPVPRFDASGDTVLDRLTGRRWTRSADLAGGALAWEDALAFALSYRARDDPDKHWRLPTIRELELLTDCSRSAPALPEGHPFAGVGEGAWSATTSAYDPAWAFALYWGKGAVGVGFKSGAHFSVLLTSPE